MGTILGLKLDVDTSRGYREGVPALLDLFGRLDIRATIFFSMGPDNSGKAIRRIFRKGFLSKMFRTRAVTTYGLKTMLYGTLLPAPMIVEPKPSILREAVARGHECGIHAWDHAAWQDRLGKLDLETVGTDLERAFALFEKITGTQARSCAAPGWQVSEQSLEAQDQLTLDYCSDSRGETPFYPVFNSRRFSVLQIPSTLPTLDEILGLDGQGPELANQRLLEGLHKGINVHTFHAEMEGIGQLSLFEKFLIECRKRGVSFSSLGEIAHSLEKEKIPTCNIEPAFVEGRAGTVACQGRKLDVNPTS